MMMKESMGERIRMRRKALAYTQQALASGIGVSHVAVSQWEKEETVPRGENLLRLAELLQCTPAWIIDGDGEVFDHATHPHAVTAVPLLSLAQAAGWSGEERLRLQTQATHFLYSDTPLSDGALAVTLEDAAMQPDFRPGDRLIFEPALEAKPGVVVLALVNSHVQVRIYRVHEQRNDAPVFSLRPLNPDFPALHSEDNQLQIIGTLVELRRRMSQG